MTLGEFVNATKHLSGDKQLFVAGSEYAHDEGYSVDKIVITVSEDGGDITLVYTE